MPKIHPKYIIVSLIENSANSAISCKEALVTGSLHLVVRQTWGMYPTCFPGTPLPLVPGLPPRTQISPVFNLLRPTMQLSSVVFPHPEAPSRPYLEMSHCLIGSNLPILKRTCSLWRRSYWGCWGHGSDSYWIRSVWTHVARLRPAVCECWPCCSGTAAKAGSRHPALRCSPDYPRMLGYRACCRLRPHCAKKRRLNQ